MINFSISSLCWLLSSRARRSLRTWKNEESRPVARRIEINSKFNVCYIFVIYISSLPLSLEDRFWSSFITLLPRNSNLFTFQTVYNNSVEWKHSLLSRSMADWSCKFPQRRKKLHKKSRWARNRSMDENWMVRKKTKPRPSRCHSHLEIHHNHNAQCSNWNDF